MRAWAKPLGCWVAVGVIRPLVGRGGGAVSEGEEGLGRRGVLLLDDSGLGGDPAYTAAGDEDLGEGV